MRKCYRCATEMVEGFEIQVPSELFGAVKIIDGAGLFAKVIAKPKVAICPECGEVSLYIENVNDISKSKK